MMDGPMIVQKKAPTLRERLFGRRDASDPQVVDFRNNTSSASSPSIENKLPPPPKALVGAPRIETPPPQIIERVGVPTLPKPPANLKASDSPGITSTSNEVCDSGITESTRRIEIPAKKTWHPGANIQNWAQGRSTPSAPKMEITQAPIVYKDRTESQKFEDRRLEKVETHLAQQNRIAEKQLAERVEKSYQPFSTAKAPGTNMSLPEAPKPSGQPFSTARPSEIKKPTPSPLAMVDEKPGVLPPAPMPKNPSTDMWGNPKSATGLEPGSIRPELTKVPAPPSTRPDPLFAPERLIAGGGNSDTVKPAAVPVAPPMMRPAPEPGTLPNPPEPTGMARPSWPVGTQSVQAASSGMAPMYIPVPTVTVPQPIHPPVPPPPNMPEAPQLNAYVNAFTPPPAPKGQQQPMPTMAQQMMYQQMMAQQQMIAQHQMLMQYGYRPNPMMSPYMPVPTSGPMANFSRHYMGPMPPMAPNPFNVSVTGYQPWSYPQMPPMQQTSYQQPAPPAPQQPVTMQVEQLIKTMRESPYPAQRELAAQSLIGFEWRAHPQIVPALVQSASQDPAASVRAGCANCLGRMNANVEPAIGVLNGLRNDIDQRVRTEAEQALVRLGQKE
jgi:hypothetical protein